jgi:hypothetical protein
LTGSGYFVLVSDVVTSQHHCINYKRHGMRTTLDIDEDVLAAAKELAKRQNLPTGQVVSQLLRKVLTGQAGQSAVSEDAGSGSSVAGFRPFPAGRSVVTNEVVNRLREAEGV